jgi:hypothetical protein
LYRLGGRSLQRWAITLAVGAAVLLVLQWWFRGQPPTPWWHWLLPASLVIGALVLWALGRWAAAHSFVKFAADTDLPPPAPATLSPSDKVQVRATGCFGVDGRSHDFADLLAYWRTFASREHAVMAIQHHSHWLVLGNLPEELVGMWYIFFSPEAVRDLIPGRLTFGADTGPALRVRYTRAEPSPDEKKPPRVTDKTAYLRFEDDATRRLVWADLLADDKAHTPAHQAAGQSKS